MLSCPGLYGVFHTLLSEHEVYEYIRVKEGPNYCPFTCIWFNDSDSWHSGVGCEPELMRKLLIKERFHSFGYQNKVRVILVHMGSLCMLENINVTALAEARMERSESRLITSRTHPSLTRNRWGVRNIFFVGASLLWLLAPRAFCGHSMCGLGGIRTLTSAAIFGRSRQANQNKSYQSIPTVRIYNFRRKCLTIGQWCIATRYSATQGRD